MAPIPPSSRVYIGEVVHKAVVEVDEQGTVAAAATSVGMRATAMPGPRPQPIQMVVDHPFFFAIRDDATGEVLFLGTIRDPR
jgi:serine protease inhibitor